MWVMGSLLAVAIIVIILMAIHISYKKHCIDDLESRLSNTEYRHKKETLNMLEQIKSYQKCDPAWRDTFEKRFLNENIEKLKKELNINCSKDNV